jgi:hypothetical protein
MADNYAAIRLALEGATESGRPSRFKPTPGKWVADDHQGWVHPQTDVRSVDLECKVVVVRAEFSCTVGKSEYEWANAAFVAAANPDTIRALLAERDALQAKVEAMEKALTDIAQWPDGPVVGAHFDEPGSATIARAALAQPTGEKP